jgi:DNA-binding response OmpR family regulator
MKVLVIEDSSRIRESLITAFRDEGWIVDATENGPEGLWYGLNYPYDAIVLDLMLPELDGETILRQWRTKGIQTPVVILTARDAVPDRIRGLNAGADDYLPKPFSIEELIARIHALLRRPQQWEAAELRVGELTVDLRRHEVRLADTVLALTPKEYRLMQFLARHADEVFSRTQIEENIFDSLTEKNSNVVEATVSSVRRKLRPFGVDGYLQTRRGHGYRLSAEES